VGQMTFEETKLKGAYIVSLNMLSDDRGLFARTFCKKEFKQINHRKEFVQMNHSWNKHKGTIRGMHYQIPPFQEVKLIRCIKGKVLDVIIDLRKYSPTFLQHVSVELSADNKKMIYVPEDFAHGFQALEDDTELIYHHTEYYMPDADRGLRYDDPALNIKWSLPPVMVSDKDKSYKLIDNSFKGN
jgi:dTDP-4-dehydrorhamnose 3,5-epimerase